MLVNDAAHRIGLEYPGGAEALGKRMGMAPRVFSNKLNPNCQTHRLTLEEAVVMQSITGRHDVVMAMADELGGVFLPLPETVEPQSVVGGIARTVAEFGDWMRRIEESLEDGDITPNELKRMEAKLIEMIATATTLHARLAGQKRAGR